MTDSSKKHFQVWLTPIVIMVAAFFITYIARQAGAFETLELKGLDFRFVQRGAIPHSDEIVVVSLDQESWESIPYDFPYPRKMWGKIVDNLTDAGAKLIVFDFQFDVTKEDTLSDLIFADAIARSGKVILPSKLNLLTQRAQVFTSISEPHPLFRDAALTTGLIGEVKDVDQYTRKYSAFFPYQEKYYLFLGLKAVKEYYEIPDSVQMLVDPNSKFIEYGPLSIRRDRLDINTFLINYYGPSKTFKTFPLADVLDDAETDLRGDADTDYMELWKENSIYPPEMLEILNPTGDGSPFKDKIVLIGDALEEHFDLKFTPFFDYQGSQRLMAGVETHAHAMQTLLDGNYLIQPDFYIENLVVLGFIILTLVISVIFGPIAGGLFALILLGAYGYFSMWLFNKQNVWIEWLPPVAAVVLALVMNTIYEFILEQREKKRIRGMFSTYMSPKILKYLEDHPDAFRLTGEKRESSIFFSDVQGFTTISESLSAEELAIVLNKYLSPMTDILMRYDGYVDKYEGDAIMCDFGVPVEDPDHAWKACWAALDQQEKLKRLREEIKAEHGVEIIVRMGINSGLVSAGNMGSNQRFQYTVMGDAVNAAARFESANKQYGTYIMIGDNTYKLAKEYIEVRILDKIVVKGKAIPIIVYNL
ncbi:MAG TPA: adenylate/guanylate cyclase domain-containing protein, partial [Candidatus Marinimicrobia bacterium]|nr:adenylate/guanylate cyclase domain-containing protein [Candidatus Neomarinimicrobiota bacterium]